MQHTPTATVDGHAVTLLKQFRSYSLSLALNGSHRFIDMPHWFRISFRNVFKRDQTPQKIAIGIWRILVFGDYHLIAAEQCRMWEDAKIQDLFANYISFTSNCQQSNDDAMSMRSSYLSPARIDLITHGWCNRRVLGRRVCSLDAARLGWSLSSHTNDPRQRITRFDGARWIALNIFVLDGVEVICEVRLGFCTLS